MDHRNSTPRIRRSAAARKWRSRRQSCWKTARRSRSTAKDLQGTWKGARFTEGAGENAGQGVKVEFTFKDGTLVGRKDSGVVIGEATFTLVDNGKSIDALGTGGGYRNKSYPGILKIEG